METLTAIASRKTIRDFEDREISHNVIEQIITAGLQAPSNNHMREWEFILLKDRDKRRALLDEIIYPIDEKGALAVINRWGMKDETQRAMYLDGIPKQYSMLDKAACLLLPCFKQESPLLKPKSLSSLNSFASIWMCIENIFIAASDQGIYGVVRIPMDDEIKIIKEKLQIPANYEIPCFIALGYPAENAKRAKQVDIDSKKKIHTDKW
jgi:nitroreductase